jgi:hypothetical protein
MAELGSATGLRSEELRAAVKAFRMGTLDAGQSEWQMVARAAALARLCEAFGFEGSLRLPPEGPGPDCWFFPDEAESVGLRVVSTADLADPARFAEPPTPAPLPGGERINGAQASIVRAFIEAQGRGAARDAGLWLVIYARLGGFSDKLWDLLRTRFAGEDSTAPFARAFVVDIGPVVRGFELG